MKSKRLFNHNYIALKKCKRGNFLYNTNDKFIGKSLDLYGEWTDDELAVLEQIIKPGDHILDIGAYIGTHTIPFAKMVGSSGHVYAFEPQRLPYYLLCSNVSINTLINVTCLNSLVSNQPGHTQVPNLDPSVPFNFGAIRLQQIHQGIPTQILTVDQLKLNKVDLIKIDVEQMELQVLQGSIQTINTHRPIMFIENNTIPGSTPILTLLKKLNYHSYWHIRPHYNPKNFFNNRTNIFKNITPDANLLCIPKERSEKISNLTPVTNLSDNFLKALKRLEKN